MSRLCHNYFKSWSEVGQHMPYHFYYSKSALQYLMSAQLDTNVLLGMLVNGHSGLLWPRATQRCTATSKLRAVS